MWDFDYAATSRKVARHHHSAASDAFMEGVQVQASPLAAARSSSLATAEATPSVVALVGAAVGVALLAATRKILARVTKTAAGAPRLPTVARRRPPLRRPSIPSSPSPPPSPSSWPPSASSRRDGPKLPPSLREQQLLRQQQHSQWNGSATRQPQQIRQRSHYAHSTPARTTAAKTTPQMARASSSPLPHSPTQPQAALIKDPSSLQKAEIHQERRRVALLERPQPTTFASTVQTKKYRGGADSDTGESPDHRWAGWGVRPPNAARHRPSPVRQRGDNSTRRAAPPPRLEFFQDARSAASQGTQTSEVNEILKGVSNNVVSSPDALKLEQKLAAAEHERDLARKAAHQARRRASLVERGAELSQSSAVVSNDVDRAIEDARETGRRNAQTAASLAARLDELERESKTTPRAPPSAPRQEQQQQQQQQQQQPLKLSKDDEARVTSLATALAEAQRQAATLARRVEQVESRVAARKERQVRRDDDWMAGLLNLFMGAIVGQKSTTPQQTVSEHTTDSRLIAQVTQLEEALEAMPHAMDEVRAAAESVAGSADALSARLNALESEVATRRDTSKRLAERIEQLERAFAAAPAVEQPTTPEQAVVEEELVEELEEIKRGLEEVVKKPLWRIDAGREVLLQGFHWDSSGVGDWYGVLNERVPDIASWGFTGVWLPPPSQSIAKQGYLPQDLYNLNSKYGTHESLSSLINSMHANGLHAVADIVINHRCANEKGRGGAYNKWSGMMMAWDERAVTTDNGQYHGAGGHGTGDDFHAAPNIDHNQDFVREDLKAWLRWLRENVGFDSLRFDFSKGYDGKFAGEYIDACSPEFSVGEYWDTCQYGGDGLEYNQDGHRQRTVNWIDRTGGISAAFDFTTKGVLQEAVGRNQYWRLVDGKGRPPGVLGIWPSHAVTFIDNHDTGSSQAHWPFPGDHVLKGYAYILTHPGSPCVLWDHVFDWGDGVRNSILALVKARQDAGIHSRSKVKVCEAREDVYGAIIDDRLAMKIGPGDWKPAGSWTVKTSGDGFCVWMKS